MVLLKRIRVRLWSILASFPNVRIKKQPSHRVIEDVLESPLDPFEARFAVHHRWEAEVEIDCESCFHVLLAAIADWLPFEAGAFVEGFRKLEVEDAVFEPEKVVDTGSALGE